MKIVKLTSQAPVSNYTDSAMDDLLLFFKNQPAANSEEINNYLIKNSSFANRYHLSPQRQMVLSWFPFSGQEHVLEIGAGCGALTGFLADKTAHVAANELMPQRADIIKYRYQNKDNIEVLLGSFEDIPTSKKYDLAVVIGVLEYAESFTKKDSKHNSYQNFLQIVKKHLKKNGKLILAIENKLALQYFAGYPEDHTGRPFDSIINYPSGTPARSFTKKELSNLLDKSGFSKQSFYLSFPSYKFPKLIIHEQHCNQNLDVTTLGDVEESQHDFIQYFPLSPVYKNLQAENILSSFAPAFIVEASV